MDVWVFADFRIPKDRNKWRTKLLELNATDVVLGCNSETSPTYKLLQSRQTYIDASLELRAAGLRVHMMTWLRPTNAYVDAVVDKFVPLAHECGATSIMLDVEGFWIKSKGHAAAAERFYGRLGPDRDMQVGVTSYTSLTKAVMPLLAEADYGLPQAYSIWDDKRPETKKKQYGPGALQKRAHRKWNEHCERIVMGLAAYKQERPHATVPEVMGAAIDATRELGIDAAAYWSLFWLKGEAGEFVRALRTAPPEPTPPEALATTDVLRRGSKDEFWSSSHQHAANVLGTQVKDLQTTLTKLGVLSGDIDGYFGKKTEAAVKQFQDASRGGWRLVDGESVQVDVTFSDAVDGIVGPKTKAELRQWLERGYRFTEPPAVAERNVPPAAGEGLDEQYRAAVMAIALAEVGVREKPRNSNRGERVELFQAAAGVPKGKAWCHAYAYWVHREAARSLGGKTTLPSAYGGSVRGFRDAMARGVTTYLPEDVLSGDMEVLPGDVGILVRDASRRDSARNGIKSSGHTFIADGTRDADDVGTVEGNTNEAGSAEGHGVYRRRRSLSDPRLVGFIRSGVKPK